MRLHQVCFFTSVIGTGWVASVATLLGLSFIPEIFLWIEFGRIGWKIQERDVGGDDKVTAAVVGRAVENQQDIFPGKLARQHIEEDLEAGCIRSRQQPLIRRHAACVGK